MNVAMITAREGQLAALRAGLERQGVRVECFAEASAFSRPPAPGAGNW